MSFAGRAFGRPRGRRSKPKKGLPKSQFSKYSRWRCKLSSTTFIPFYSSLLPIGINRCGLGIFFWSSLLAFACGLKPEMQCKKTKKMKVTTDWWMYSASHPYSTSYMQGYAKRRPNKGKTHFKYSHFHLRLILLVATRHSRFNIRNLLWTLKKHCKLAENV